ncbi:MAG TPA: adenine phosphoribosyltransferase [Clostridia bacterium]|nr:adenine phosphoribosyltransferase [Clostridia bacterium]
MNLMDKIRIIPDFPKTGISFKDITTLLHDREAYKYTVESLVGVCKEWNPDLVVGPEARGFVIGAPLAYALGVGFVPVRKPGKLPGKTELFEYDLEYGKDALEIHSDAITKGQRIVIVDDLLATGGTSLATARLVERLGGIVVGMTFVIELSYLGGRERLGDYNIHTLVQYEED